MPIQVGSILDGHVLFRLEALQFLQMLVLSKETRLRRDLEVGEYHWKRPVNIAATVDAGVDVVVSAGSDADSVEPVD